jgi:tetratricopeptide (TPR) repeat protein
VKNRINGFIILFLLLSLSACKIGGPYFSVLQGNYAFNRGRYQMSIVHYLDAMQYEGHQDWVLYNMGNVYHSLGELPAAFEAWKDVSEQADVTDEIELAFRTQFNQGVLNYELGKYEDAYKFFRNALILKSTNLEAKINLELTLRKMEAVGTLTAKPEAAEEVLQESSRNSQRILEYVKRKEGKRWQAQEQNISGATATDY